jgi:hypothetical protein
VGFLALRRVRGRLFLVSTIALAYPDPRPDPWASRAYRLGLYGSRLDRDQPPSGQKTLTTHGLRWSVSDDKNRKAVGHSLRQLFVQPALLACSAGTKKAVTGALTKNLWSLLPSWASAITFSPLAILHSSVLLDRTTVRENASNSRIYQRSNRDDFEI